MKAMSKLNAVFFIIAFCCSCNNSNPNPQQNNPKGPVAVPQTVNADSAAVSSAPQANNDTTSFHGAQIPIICYHQIREWRSTDSKSARVYIISPDNFRDQIKMLHDSGFHSILPDQLIAYLQRGEKLPSRPVMITLDDATGPQYDIGLPELDKYGFKGVFFIMTVVLGHPNYMTKDEVKDLAARGQDIECHTWDHHPTTKYQDKDWPVQIEKPRAELEQITGKPIKYFAYPFGLWNANAVEHLKKYGFTAAFQLAEKRDLNNPLYTIRRIIASGTYDRTELYKAIKRSFKVQE
jgi:peptidoglycan/xylan/chitin deacetylase (PgdA/CDA1 family)